ncbi:hypothetical protein ECAE60S_01449 [Eoetvoesiella caeni]
MIASLRSSYEWKAESGQYDTCQHQHNMQRLKPSDYQAGHETACKNRGADSRKRVENKSLYCTHAHSLVDAHKDFVSAHGPILTVRKAKHCGAIESDLKV